MKIGINLLGESPFKSGTGRYASELIKALLSIDKTNHYILFVPWKSADSWTRFICTTKKPNNCKIVSIPITGNLIFRRISEQLLLPYYVFFNGVDILHSTNTVCPIINTSIDTVTIHDTARWDLYYFRNIKDSFLRTLSRFSALVARKIFTVSSFSKKRISQIYNVNDSKIELTLLGSPVINDLKIKGNQVSARELIDDDKRYIISVSSLESRKNYPMLIKALSLSNTPLRLKIVGKKAEGFDALIKAINENNLQDRVDILGFVDDAELDNLISGAMFYVFVSKYEGAGLTPLEAMVKSKAVIASDIDPIREYCEDACLYVDPNDAHSIARAINLFYTDTRLRNEFVNKGLEQVKKWSWQNTALATLKIWQKLVSK